MKRLLILGLYRFMGVLPWAWIDVLSGLIYQVLYHLLKYRKNVVEDNLKRCFPEWSVEKRAAIMREFYRHFCDLMLETLKSKSLNEKTILKHARIIDNETSREMLASPDHAIILFGHYHNWEWLTMACGHFFNLQHQQRVIGFFKTMRDKTVEKIMNDQRTAFGGEMYSDQQPLRVVRLLKGKDKIVLGTVADQTPPGKDQMFMLDFLNTPTPFFTGPGWIAASTGAQVYYGRLRKPRRHQYEIEFEPLYKNVPGADKNKVIEEITRMYARKLEQQIREYPQYWLWSHRRWKYVREK